MGGLHSPFDREFFVMHGAVKKEGYSLGLAKGQVGVFDVNKTTKKGSKVVDDFTGLPKDTMFEIRVGKSEQPLSRTNSNKSFSTFPFNLSGVKKLKVSVPKKTEQEVDDVIIGYNGIDDDTALKFSPYDERKMVVRLSGEPIGLLGYDYNYVDIPISFDIGRCSPFKIKCTSCDPCDEYPALPIVLDAIKELKGNKLRGDIKVTDFIDIKPIKSCSGGTPPVTEDYKFYTLNVTDSGDSNAEALVKGQYPNFKVVKSDRKGVTSTYKVLLPASEGKPADFKLTLPSVIKGCADCKSDYTKFDGGYLYSLSINDSGVDASNTLKGKLSNVVDIKKHGTDVTGKGYYTFITSVKLDDDTINTFVDNDFSIALSYIGEVSTICKNDTINTISWVEGEVCQATKHEYQITLKDTSCGTNRLEELKSHYPDLTIELEGTTGGCQTRYKTSVITNIVCEECDEIYKDIFVSEAPTKYEGKSWKLVTQTDYGTDCKVGIRITGKKFKLNPSECLRDEFGFMDTSVKVEVSGGWEEDYLMSNQNETKWFNVEYLSRATPRTHLGANLWQKEQESFTFFNGTQRHDKYSTRTLLGEESSLDYSKQYVDYALTLSREYYSQSFAGKEQDNITYHFFVPVGRHEEVENMLNKLAVASGISPVRAFSK